MIRTTCAWAPAGLWRTNPLSTHSFAHSPLRTTNKYARPSHKAPAPSPARVTRRYNASQPPVAQKAPETTKTIPGPSWLWLEPIYGPFRAYGRVQQRRPYMTQFISSLVIYFVGDLVAQSIGKPASAVEDGNEADMEEAEEEEEKGWVQKWSDERDWSRTARALLIGGAAAVPGYKWFLWLGNSFNYSSKILSLTTKVTVNQILFTPIFNSYFFGMQSLLCGATFSEMVERIQHTVPTSWINSCKIWPAVTAFSFTFIPIQYRSIFGGVIAIGWQTYLSMLNQRAAAEEKVEHAHQGEHETNTPTAAIERSDCRGDEQRCAV